MVITLYLSDNELWQMIRGEAVPEKVLDARQQILDASPTGTMPSVTIHTERHYCQDLWRIETSDFTEEEIKYRILAHGHGPTILTELRKALA